MFALKEKKKCMLCATNKDATLKNHRQSKVNRWLATPIYTTFEFRRSHVPLHNKPPGLDPMPSKH